MEFNHEFDDHLSNLQTYGCTYCIDKTTLSKNYGFVELQTTTLIIPISAYCYLELPRAIAFYSGVSIFTNKISRGCLDMLEHK